MEFVGRVSVSEKVKLANKSVAKHWWFFQLEMGKEAPIVTVDVLL